MNRKAEIGGETRETAVNIAIDLDGKGQADVGAGRLLFLSTC